MKKLLYILLAFFSITKSFATDLGLDRIDDRLKNGDISLVDKVDNIMGYIIGLLYFIAVAFGIYAGFVILTSGGEEERVKKGKQILIYVVIGLVVIFLASQLVTWIADVMTSTDVTG